MANTYVVTSAQYIPGPLDPIVTIAGSVNGVPVIIQMWLSAILPLYIAQNYAALQKLIAPIMLAQANINQPPAAQVPVNFQTGTFIL